MFSVYVNIKLYHPHTQQKKQHKMEEQQALAKTITFKKLALLSGSAVSRTVPSAKTIRKSFRVWYVFWDTPQHIPLELFETIPPTMQESIDEGSGPILYWIGWLVFFAKLARIRLISPPIRPGSTVI